MKFDDLECRLFNSTNWNTDRDIPWQQQQQQQRQQQQQPQQQQLQQQQMTRLVKLIMGSSSEKLRSHAPVARSPFAGCSVCLWTHCLFPSCLFPGCLSSDIGFITTECEENDCTE